MPAVGGLRGIMKGLLTDEAAQEIEGRFLASSTRRRNAKLFQKVWFYNQRGTAEQWIKVGKNAVK
jgi:hypothetical protein